MRILFLQKRLVLPPDTGGKIRTHNILKHLARWHEVTYLSNVLDDERQYLPAMRELGVEPVALPWREPARRSLRFATFALKNLLSSPYPLNVDKDYDPGLRRRAKELLREGKYDLVVCDFVQMARNAIGLGKASLLFQHNVEAEIFSRIARSSRWPMSVYMHWQYQRMHKFEKKAGECFSRVVAVSDRDREIFEREYGWQHVRVIDTAVDTSYYRPDPQTTRCEKEIVFIGSLDWWPNRKGLLHFANVIYPNIRERIPDVKLTLVGRNPSAEIRGLSELPGVSVAANVPDTRPYLQRAALTIVPIYAGGGTRLKIFEAMACGTPVVSTSLGAEGLDVAHREHLLIADSDRDFSDAVVGLLTDRQTASSMSDRALARVCERFAAEPVARQFEKFCQEAVESIAPLGDNMHERPGSCEQNPQANKNH